MSQRYNVQLITIDSCQYEVAKTAKTPFLATFGNLRKAEAHATFTLPSHFAMFAIGKMPESESKYVQGFDELWRSGGARQTSKKILEFFDEATIIKHYEKIGYNVQGFGGVQFFNPSLAVDVLPKMFSNFTYYGPEKFIKEDKLLPRSIKQLPLGNIEDIVSKVKGERPYFMFLNCSETHIPYDTPAWHVDADYIALVSKLISEHGRKVRYAATALPFTKAELDLLRQAQRCALEWVDSQLAKLLPQLANGLPTLTIIVGDHGEEFGESGRFGHAHNAKEVREVPLWCCYK